MSDVLIYIVLAKNAYFLADFLDFLDDFTDGDSSEFESDKRRRFLLDGCFSYGLSIRS